MLYLSDILARIKKSPLKPFQKLSMLRTNVIPKLSHGLVLGRITKGLLSSYDLKIRDFLKSILRLPNDIPSSYFYVKIKDGGLGIQAFSDLVPSSIVKRTSKFGESSDPVINELLQLDRVQSLITRCYTMAQANAGVDIKMHREKAHRNDLYQTVDGKPLSQHPRHHKGQSWVRGKTKILTGRSFNNLIKLRIGRLSTKENCTRGRKEADKKCRH